MFTFIWLSRLSVNYDDGKLKARFVSFRGLAAIAKHLLNFYLLLITSKHIILIFLSGGFIIALFFLLFALILYLLYTSFVCIYTLNFSIFIIFISFHSLFSKWHIFIMSDFGRDSGIPYVSDFLKLMVIWLFYYWF